MSRIKTWASSGWINSYYWVKENGVVLTDGFDLNEWSWTIDAACRDSDPDSFFEPDSQGQRAELVRVCTACPVRRECLEHAMANDEVGWWGGMTRTDRRRLQAGRDG